MLPLLTRSECVQIATQRCYGPGNEETVKSVVFGVVTPYVSS